MVVLSVKNISKSYGIKKVLDNISFHVEYGEKIGIIGINGAGKSTLFRILSGKTVPDTGEVFLKKGCSLGYLPQHTGLDSNRTVWDELDTVFTYLHNLEKELRSLEKKMAVKNKPEMDKLMREYSSKLESYEKQGGYEINSRISGTLKGLGFSEEDYDKKISTLSGGQKTRIALGKLLLQKPDILLLDEPTNYLDIPSAEWLEDFLITYKGTVMVISHDRYFLDRISTRTIEIENNKLNDLEGSYSAFIKKKHHLRQQQWKHYTNQQEEINKIQQQIQQYKAWRKFSQASSREKMLEKTQIIERPSSQPKRADISFKPRLTSGRKVLKLENISLKFGDDTVFSNISFSITRGERVALIGPNGIGKSSLLKIIAGNIKLLSGKIQLGHNVIVGYYRQELENLNTENTILDEVWEVVPKMKQSQLRTILGSFLFSEDEVFKKISKLSGGEKSRVSLAKLMLSGCNLLLLDEPTNHLDMPSKEALEDAILNYQGTILVVSHDRYFLDRVATRVLEMNSEGIADYPGNYSYYKTKRQQLQNQQRKEKETDKPARPKTKQRQTGATQKQAKDRLVKIKVVEEEIITTEDRIKEMEALLCEPEIFSDEKRAKEINLEYNRLKKNLQALYKKWESLV